jgi:hypothetical protein
MRSPRLAISAGIALATLLFSIAPTSAQVGGRWTISLGGGTANQFAYHRYSYSFGDYSDKFGFARLAVAGAGYRFTDRVTLRADAGYLAYHTSFWGDLSGLSSRMPFLSTGIRVYAAGRASSQRRLYAEALPTIWLSHWREQIVVTQDVDGALPSRVDEAAFTRLDPGITAGAGLLGPLSGSMKLDVGVRYLLSVGVGPHNLGHVSTGDFKGLRQFAVVVSLNRAI